jgi:hypothetical protein
MRQHLLQFDRKNKLIKTSPRDKYRGLSLFLVETG